MGRGRAQGPTGAMRVCWSRGLAVAAEAVMDPDHHHHIENIGSDVARLRIGFVNVYFVGTPRVATPNSAAAIATPWALVDAGLSAGTRRILDICAKRYGNETQPRGT